MSERPSGRLTRQSALRLEFGVIGLGVVALLMIFQPVSLTLFSLGCGLVVLAALSNNLLPLAVPGEPVRAVVQAGVVVAVIFCTALLVAITAAHLYGLAFLNPPTVTSSLRPPAPPFWHHPLVWWLAAADLFFVVILTILVRRS